MIGPNPCRGCTERYTACHDRCEKHKTWLDQHRAEQKHLTAMKSRWQIPWSSARERTDKSNIKFGAGGHKYGGSQ